MANFEDYLNDFSIDGEPEEELAPPQVNSDYDSYRDNFGGSDRYRYDDTGSYSSGYDRDSYGASDDYGSNSGSRYSSDEEYDNSFAEDYEDKPKRSIKMPNFNAKGNAPQNSAKSGGKDIGSSKALIFLLLACAVASFISVFSVASLKKTVSDMGTSLSGQIAALSAATSQLSERVSALEAGVTTVQQTTTSASNNSQYINIVKEPSSVNSYVGRGDGGDGGQIGLFFEIVANGNGVTYNSFTWYKQDASGQWVSVAFDGTNSKNEVLGLQNETGKYTTGDYTGSCYSKIYAVGLTSEGFGKYKCLVTDSAGEKKWSQEVTISNQ